MLFGYFGEPSPQTSDVLKLEADIRSLHFDRPLYEGDELFSAGALAFALSYGFGGLSLAEWASIDLTQTAGPRGPHVVQLDAEVYDWLAAIVEAQRAACLD